MDDCASLIVAVARMTRYRPHVLFERRGAGRGVVLLGWHARADALECVCKPGIAGTAAIGEVFRLAVALVAVKVHHIEGAARAAQHAELRPPDGLLRAIPLRPIGYEVRGLRAGGSRRVRPVRRRYSPAPFSSSSSDSLSSGETMSATWSSCSWRDSFSCSKSEISSFRSATSAR